MIGIIVGTRPEIIKMLPIIHECESRGSDYKILNSYQNFSVNMNSEFLEEFGIDMEKIDTIPRKDVENLDKRFRLYKEDNLDIVLVQGDTDTAFFSALYAKRNKISVGHIEAGLRCGDLYMFEEQNRIFIDHIADLNFAPTTMAKANLQYEGIDLKRIRLTGNTIVESLEYLQKKHEIPVKNFLNNHILLTIHRRENLDKVRMILSIVDYFCEENNLKAVFPCHPHTADYLKKEKAYDNIMISEPIGYKEFIESLLTCKFVITDSGGVQEESCILKVPCITMRKSTERPETLTLSNILFDTDKLKTNDDVLKVKSEFFNAVKTVLKRDMRYVQPYSGAGTISKQIVDVVEEFIEEE